MLVTGQAPQCTWALEGSQAGHLFHVCPSPGHWTHWRAQEGHHSGSPKAASVLTISHVEDTEAFPIRLFKKIKWSPHATIQEKLAKPA